MRVLLLANQPERTTRLRMFGATLAGLGHEVTIPRFDTRNWLDIARKARSLIMEERPDVVHVFNVPDIIYHGLSELKGRHFRILIYDYRSPWGIELQRSFGPVARFIGERFERELANGADMITTVNTPMAAKVSSYREASGKPVYVIPNYPPRSFAQVSGRVEEGGALVFVGRISQQEGIGKLLGLARSLPSEKFWIIGDGPFAWWHLRKKPENVRLFGYQPHERVAQLVRGARLCLIPQEETEITPYATDKSVWKLNEYLNLGRTVIASGITKEEERKNLVVVKSTRLREAVLEHLDREPEKLSDKDYRFWESNDRTIKEVYERLDRI